MSTASLAWRILQTRLTGARVPISVCLELTHRCNAHCSYCEISRDSREEMNTAEIKIAIDEFRAAGMERLGLTGGEPMLRDDLPEIIRHARRHGVYVSLNSNGQLVVDQSERLVGIQTLVLSLNGDDRQHGETKEGVDFANVVAAIEWARRANLDVITITTLTGKNLNVVPFVTELARTLGCWCTFQPVLLCGTRAALPAGQDFDRIEMVRTVDQIIDAKRRGLPVANSWRYLDYFRRFYTIGNVPPPRCPGGRYIVTVLPDGTVAPCNIQPIGVTFANGWEVGYVRAFREMPSFLCKSFCAGPFFELNDLFALRPSAWLNAARIEWKRRRTHVSKV